MNDLTHDFWNSLRDAAKGLSSGLRIESGITSKPEIVTRQDGNLLVFITEDTNSRILKRHLGPILDAAIKAVPPISMAALAPNPQDYPELDGTGMVCVSLTPPVIDYLTARFE